MTSQIFAVLAILACALALFVSERLRADLVAMMVLCALGLGGFVTPAEAIAGFSNPAVVTIWAMFILSAGLAATGVAEFIGNRLVGVVGRSEPLAIVVIMMVTGVLSGFMNNIGVAAMMLPVVMDICRRTGMAPSRLLMPMAFASLLGGLTTLVGTSLNLVASGVLIQAGFEGLSLFSFTPFGVPALVAGTVFVALFGRRLLPDRAPDSIRASREEASEDFQFSHQIEERLFRLRVAPGSPFAGSPLSETSLGAVLGLNVRSISRGETLHAPVGGDFALAEGDLLEVQGRREEFDEFLRWKALEVARGSEIAELLSMRRLALVSASIAEESELAGLTVAEADFRRRFRAHILTIRRDGKVMRGDMARRVLEAGDRLQLEVKREDLPALIEDAAFAETQVLSEESFGQIYSSADSLLELDIPEDSKLAGRSVAESGFGDSLGLRIVAIGRKPESVFFPEPEETIRPGDKLLVHGGAKALQRVRGIQSLELVEELPADERVPSGPHGGEVFTEATLSPRSSLAGRTLRELDFRQRYGLQVLSIWRRGRAYRSHLRNFKLEFGDGLLLAGTKERIRSLHEDRDFLLLSMPPADRERRSPLSALTSSLLVAAVAATVMLGWLPVELAALAGATLMVLTRCLSIEEAHRAIEWKSVFLIACMIPLGTAMQNTGAASWLAKGIVAATDPLGVWGLVAGLYLVTALGTTVVPAAALVLVMSLVGIDAAAEAGVSPHFVVMAVAFAAAASFASPISHPANILVMGPGGYRFGDYLRLGLLLAAVVMVTVLPLLFWLQG